MNPRATQSQSSLISLTNRVGEPKTTQSKVGVSTREVNAQTFSFALWFEWVCKRVNELRNIERNHFQENAIREELQKRNYSYADAVMAEQWLIMGTWSSEKIATGIEISDFYRERVEISQAEIVSFKKKAYAAGFNEGKSENTQQMHLTEEEKPLMASITRLQTELLNEKAKTSEFKSIIPELMKLFSERNINPPKKIEFIFNKFYAKP